jgi:hypothetical protein
MVGLDLSAERSGKTSESAIPVISKKGKADLRYALYQAAFIASTKNQDFIIILYQQTSRSRKRARETTLRPLWTSGGTILGLSLELCNLD